MARHARMKRPMEDKKSHAEGRAISNNTTEASLPRSRQPITKMLSYGAWKSAIELGVEELKMKPKSEATTDEPIPLNRDSQGLALSPSHYIYREGTWDGAPIVIPEYKLLFFSIPKVGCTVFKQLFRRIAGCQDWRQTRGGLPHDPTVNDLKYLYHYSKEDAFHILTSEEWTRAIFVRDPKARVLSAYLNKALTKKARYITTHCCPQRKKCGRIAMENLTGFLQVVRSCRDPHWAPQSKRMEGRYWPYIDFVGHIESAAEDTKALLEQLGAWREYGFSGWGKDGTEPIFASTGTVRHSTGASDKLREYYDEETERMVEDLYAEDLWNPLFEFNSTRIVVR